MNLKEQRRIEEKVNIEAGWANLGNRKSRKNWEKKIDQLGMREEK